MVSKRYRSAVTGEMVTKEYAEANPDTTVAETIEDEVEVDEVVDEVAEPEEADLLASNEGPSIPRPSDGTRSKGAQP